MWEHVFETQTPSSVWNKPPTVAGQRWFSELNPEQQAAVHHPGGPLLVLAGAGTGKTTTLCARVAWLITTGVRPERILLLTFTRRAAREMLQRVRAMTGGRSAETMFV